MRIMDIVGMDTSHSAYVNIEGQLGLPEDQRTEVFVKFHTGDLDCMEIDVANATVFENNMLGQGVAVRRMSPRGLHVPRADFIRLFKEELFTTADI
jgi:hypothetical protein